MRGAGALSSIAPSVNPGGTAEVNRAGQLCDNAVMWGAVYYRRGRRICAAPRGCGEHVDGVSMAAGRTRTMLDGLRRSHPAPARDRARAPGSGPGACRGISCVAWHGFARQGRPPPLLLALAHRKRSGYQPEETRQGDAQPPPREREAAPGVCPLPRQDTSGTARWPADAAWPVTPYYDTVQRQCASARWHMRRRLYQCCDDELSWLPSVNPPRCAPIVVSSCLPVWAHQTALPTHNPHKRPTR